MTNELRKLIIAQKFVKFGLYLLRAIGQLYQPKVWAGLQSLVMVVVRHLWNKTTREVSFI